VESRFGKQVLHLADSSRVSGNATYGEATVRDTGSGTLRSSHHTFHLDNHWQGVGQLMGATEPTAANALGIEAVANSLWPLIHDDLSARASGKLIT